MWIYETLSHCLTFVYGAIKSQLKFNSLVDERSEQRYNNIVHNVLLYALLFGVHSLFL